MITTTADLQATLTNKQRADVGNNGELILETASTITLAQAQGVGIVGQGQGWAYPSGAKGVKTIIRWTGPANPTAVVLRLTGVLDCFLRDITIDGNNLAGIGIEYSSQPGYGSTGLETNHVAVRNCTSAAISCGIKPDEYGCDHSTHTALSIVNCGNGFQTCCHQSVVHTFVNPFFALVQTCYDLQYGGNVAVYGGHLGEFDRMLKAGYGGPNARVNAFYNIRAEMGGKTQRHADIAWMYPADQMFMILEGFQETEFPVNSRLPDNSSSALITVGRGAVADVTRHTARGTRKLAKLDGGSMKVEGVPITK